MKRTLLLLLTLGGALVLACSGVVLAQDETEPTTPAAGQDVEQEEVTELPVSREPRGERFAPGKLIVKLNEEASTSALEELNRRHGGRTDRQLAPNLVPGLYRVSLAPGLAVRDAVGRYRSSGDVEFAEPDFTRSALLEPTDAWYPQENDRNNPDEATKRLWGLNNYGQNSGTNDADIDAPEAWDTTTGGNSATVVAVIDSGVNYLHPDLDGNQSWRNPNETANGSDDDGNGLIDDIRGYDWVNDDNNPMDDRGHGSHVAGTIAAQANNSTATTGGAVVGVNWNAQIMALKFLNSQGLGSTSDAISALDYAVDQGAKLSNNSWGGGGFSQALLDVIKEADAAGHLFIAAAGNSGANNDTTPVYPAGYPSPNIVAVAATDRNDQLWSSSNYGASSVDLAAPGVSIWSAYFPSATSNNRYASSSGTSMAAPHVTGVASLIKSYESALDDAGIKKRLLESVDKEGTNDNRKLESLAGKVCSEGRLNASSALKATTDTLPPCVHYTYPQHEQRRVPKTADVTAAFSEAMNESTITGENLTLEFVRQGEATPIPATVSYDSETYTATLDPTDTLRSGIYRVTVKTAVEDEAGNALAEEKVWHFSV